MILQIGAQVNPYGSFLSNLFTRSGDLDLSIDLTVPSTDSNFTSYLLTILQIKKVCSVFSGFL